MKVAACPGCGAPVEFRVPGSLVSVCDFCASAVGRADGKPEDYGRVAELVETNSIAVRGLRGKFRGKPFEVVGRVQYQHGSGAVWDEWYLAFSDGRWGWLAEAQGQLCLTFEKHWKKSQQLSFDDLPAGQQVSIRSTPFTVADKGVGTAMTAAGELPWKFRPGDDHRYADLHGPEKQYASISFDEDGPHLYVGQAGRRGGLGARAAR